MDIEIIKLEKIYCDDIAEILSTDIKLHNAISSSTPLKRITGYEYYNGCLAWEKRKSGSNHIILYDEKPIGSISYHTIDNLTAGCGYWIKSNLWNKGYGKEAFSKFLQIIKNAGFKYVTASILKGNEASWKLWTKYTDHMKEDELRYTPIIMLE